MINLLSVASADSVLIWIFPDLSLTINAKRSFEESGRPLHAQGVDPSSLFQLNGDPGSSGSSCR